MDHEAPTIRGKARSGQAGSQKGVHPKPCGPMQVSAASPARNTAAGGKGGWRWALVWHVGVRARVAVLPEK